MDSLPWTLHYDYLLSATRGDLRKGLLFVVRDDVEFEGEVLVSKMSREGIPQDSL